MLAFVLVLAGALAPAASGVVVHGAKGQLLGVTPQKGVRASQLPGAIVPRATSAKPAHSSGDMTYHGGPVLHSSAPYAVFWDPTGGAAFPTRWEPLLEQYFTDVAAAGTASSNVYGVDHQYWDHSGYAGASQTFSASQVIQDGHTYPGVDNSTCSDTAVTCITDVQIQQELTRLLSTTGLPTDGPANASALPDNAPVYFVVLPPNVDECFSFGDCAAHDYCSYHSAFVDGGEEVLYDVIPSLVLDTNPKNCQIDGNSALQEPNDTRADVMLKYLTHEATETITDPLLNGWYSTADNNNEVADNCNQYGPAFDPSTGSDPDAFTPTLGGTAAGATLYNQIFGSDGYYLQGVWTNTRGDCALQPAVGTTNAQFTSPAGPDLTGTALTFDSTGSSSSNGYSSVIWGWGDGTTPQLTHGTPAAATSHTYQAAGTYTVTMTIVDTEGNIATASHQVVVYAPLVAAFTYSPSTSYAGNAVQFDASSSTDPNRGEAITGYEWDFGDGNTDSGATPGPHTYTDPGTYPVTLTVTDSVGLTSSTQHSVTVTAEPPQGVSFTLDPTAPKVGQSVGFDASATDPHATITNYSWDFGDGQTSPVNSDASTTHPYAQSGTYAVSLTVSASNGTSTTVTESVTVGPAAAFTYSPLQPQNGTQITFDGSGSSTEPGTTVATYEWTFDDGTPSESAHTVAHAFTSPGNHNVTLTVINSLGETNSVSRTVTVGDVPPTTTFSVRTLVPTEGQPVSFDASASAPSDPAATITTYAWTFGDGITGSGPTPTHSYASSGSYLVTLTAIDSHGASSNISEQVVVHALPTAAFSSSPAQPLAGAPVSFDGGSSADPESGIGIASYAWSFGDGAAGAGRAPTHAYASAGAYTVTLSVTNGLGLTRTTSRQVTVVAPPHAAFVLRTAHPANGRAVSFASSSTDSAAAISTYRWTFGDGSAPRFGATSSHVFRNPGSFAVTLIVTDGFGHTSAVTRRIKVALAGKITKVSLMRAGRRLRVALNAPGVLSGEGRTIKVKKAGTVALPLRLTAAQRRGLASNHTVTLHVVLRFTPAAGAPQTRTVIIMFRRAHAALARLTNPQTRRPRAAPAP